MWDDRGLIEIIGDFWALIRTWRNLILNLRTKDLTHVENYLRKGDELCRGRMIPMSPRLIHKVRNIYTRCQMELGLEDTPLIVASTLGLADMVWGFIECAKQINLRTGRRSRRSEMLDFLWQKNKDKRTALDIAIDCDHMEVVKVLLSNASISQLTSAWSAKGGTLLHRDPKFDGFIFDMLEEAKRPEVDSPTLTSMLIKKQDESAARWWEIYERRKYLDKLDHSLLGLNPNNNTILHLVSKFGDVKYVNDILKNDPSLLYCPNSDGETPVYVAAREGHVDVLEMMITNLKEKNEGIESLLIRRKDKHTALHIAIQNHHAVVVFWLLKEIPQLAKHINYFNESPLYLAAQRNYDAILILILVKCKEAAFEGPNGKTALHAAAISNSEACVYYLLNEKPSLLYDKDEYGWTPFHYAVHHNSSLATKRLLDADHSIGYELMTPTDITTSAVHIAASRGHCETMEVLMNICLGCTEFIDDSGRNILHIAVENKQRKVTELIFRNESLSSLINQKDINGNTPVHLLAASDFEMMEIVIDSRVDLDALNNRKLTPLDMISSEEKRERLIKAVAMGTNIHDKRSFLSPKINKSDSYEKELEARFKVVDNLVLVVTLIATATFAAAFTVPGGFNSNNGSKEGTPYLLRKSAFQAFVVTNAIAFSCACSVLLGHIVLLIYRNSYDEAGGREQKYINDRIWVMYVLTGIALVAMLIAFVTGLYVVLTPTLGLAISVCVMTLSIIVLSFFA